MKWKQEREVVDDALGDMRQFGGLGPRDLGVTAERAGFEFWDLKQVEHWN